MNIEKSSYSELFEYFRTLGLYEFLGFEDDIYEYLVREFYAKMSVVKKSVESGIVLKTMVKGKIVKISEDRVCKWLNLIPGGVRPTRSNDDRSLLRKENINEDDESEEIEEDWEYNDEFGDNVVRSLAVVPISLNSQVEAMYLPMKYRLLHYAINWNVFPKKASKNYIAQLDKEFFWHLEEGRDINFAHLMMKMFKRKFHLLHGEVNLKSTKHKGMPCGPHITKILRESKINLNGEEFTPFHHNWRVTSSNLTNMKLVKTVEQCWFYGLHTTHLGFTLVDTEKGQHAASKRNRPKARPSGAWEEDIEYVTTKIESVNAEVWDVQTRVCTLDKKLYSHNAGLVDRVSAMEKTLEKVASFIEKMWEKMSCKKDDVAPPK